MSSSTFSNATLTLCKVCASLDFGYIFSREIQGHHRIDLGLLTDIEKRAYCPFCRLVLVSVELKWHIIELMGIERATYSCKLGTRSASSVNSNIDSTKSSLFYISVSSDKEPTFFSLAPYIVPIFGSYPHLTSVGAARHFDNVMVETRLMKSWITACQNNHEECNSPIAHSYHEDKIHIRLIDIEQQKIVSACLPCDCVAPSYVWGNFKQQVTMAPNLGTAYRSFSNNESYQQTLPEKLPGTIKHAIHVTKALGKNYLWVDLLCIQQDNPEDCNVQIRLMDKIYQNAFLTIIAAHGDDANWGLQGLPNTSREDNQFVQNVNGRALTITMDPLNLQLCSSKWYSRAWTYQEGYMARRCLIFLEYECAFVCQKGIYRESLADIEYDPLMMEAPQCSSLIPPDLCCSHTSTTRCREFEFLVYSEVIRRYTGREMTFDSDALNACTGVLKHLSQMLGSSFVYGLPTLALGLALL